MTASENGNAYANCSFNRALSNRKRPPNSHRKYGRMAQTRRNEKMALPINAHITLRVIRAVTTSNKARRMSDET
jgi:hypothetical protein